MDRVTYLSRLESEASVAEGYGDSRRAAELRTQIRRASAGTPGNPATETTTRRKPAARKSRN